MKHTLHNRVLTIVMTIAVVLTSGGFTGFMQPQTAQAQGSRILDIVVGGQGLVLDACQGLTGSRYEAIAAELGLDLQGGIQGGITALGEELRDPASDAGQALLNGLGDLGGSLANSRIGDAVAALGSDIAGLFDGVDLSGVDLGGFGDTIGSLASGIGSIAGSPIVGNILGGVMDGLLGGGGPDPVVEKGLRKLEEQGQKIALFEQRKMTEKERCLDSLARQAGQRALRNLTEESVDWLQEGFTRFDEEGNSGFVENLEQHLIDTGEYEYNQYLNETQTTSGGPLSGTCNFLRRPVLESIAVNHIKSTEPAGPTSNLSNISPGTGGGCALTDGGMTEQQAEAFLEGDFAAGGWSAFIDAARDPGSSPIGAYLQQKNELDRRKAEARDRELEQLQWGQGFLADTSGGFTPASVVRGITERLFTSDISRLELIDEMDEIAGDLGSTLIGQISGGDDPNTPENEALVGLSNLDGSQTVGGELENQYGYLSENLTEAIEEQLAIEQEIADLLPALVGTDADPGIYSDSDVDQLVADAQSCIEGGNLSYSNADLLIGNIVNDQDLFRNTILLNRTKIDWNGDPLEWIPVIKEETPKMIGWNGKDYDWANDDVDRYYNQGTDQGCGYGSDDNQGGGNASYVIRKEIIPDPRADFQGLFLHIPALEATTTSEMERFAERNITTVHQGVRSGEKRNLIDDIFSVETGAVGPRNYEKEKGDTVYDFGVNTADEAGVYWVWEKQVCGDDNEDGLDWNESPLTIDHSDGDSDDFPDTPAGRIRQANAQCDLATGYNYCLYPAYRAPRIISGELYKENNDRQVQASRCRTRDDAGTHYFVELNINNRGATTTWSTRECVLRNSPQGSAAEWEDGFPESAGETNLPAYGASTSTNPVEEQLQLVQDLNRLLDELAAGERDFFDIQQEFYTLQDQFNDPDAAENLRQQTENFIRDVRELNSLLRESDSCSASHNPDLDDFGSEFVQISSTNGGGSSGDNNGGTGGDGGGLISSFNVTEVSQGYQVSWQASADSCTAAATPPADSWSGQVGASGSRLVIDDGNPINLVTLELTCSLDGQADRQTYDLSEENGMSQNNNPPGKETDVDVEHFASNGTQITANPIYKIAGGDPFFYLLGIIEWSGNYRLYVGKRDGDPVYFESSNLASWSGPKQSGIDGSMFMFEHEGEVYGYKDGYNGQSGLHLFTDFDGNNFNTHVGKAYDWKIDGSISMHVANNGLFRSFGRVRGNNTPVDEGGWGGDVPPYPEPPFDDRRGISYHANDEFEAGWNTNRQLVDPADIFDGYHEEDEDFVPDFYDPNVMPDGKAFPTVFWKQKSRQVDRGSDLPDSRRYRLTGEIYPVPAKFENGDMEFNFDYGSVIPKEFHEVRAGDVGWDTVDPDKMEIGEIYMLPHRIEKDEYVYLFYKYRQLHHYEGSDDLFSGVYSYRMKKTAFEDMFDF